MTSFGDFVTPVGAEGGTEDPGADEGASLLVLAPARQLPLGEQPLVLCGLLGADVDDDDVQLAHDGGSLGLPLRRSWRPTPPRVNPCRTARCHQGTCTTSAFDLVGNLVAEAAVRCRAELDIMTPGGAVIAVTALLEREGVRSFCDSYHQLLGCIERKIAAGAAR